MPTVGVYGPECIRNLRSKVRRQAELTREKLSQLDTGGMESLYVLKFGNSGHHPV